MNYKNLSIGYLELLLNSSDCDRMEVQKELDKRYARVEYAIDDSINNLSEAYIRLEDKKMKEREGIWN